MRNEVHSRRNNKIRRSLEVLRNAGCNVGVRLGCNMMPVDGEASCAKFGTCAQRRWATKARLNPLNLVPPKRLTSLVLFNKCTKRQLCRGPHHPIQIVPLRHDAETCIVEEGSERRKQLGHQTIKRRDIGTDGVLLFTKDRLHPSAFHF